MTFDPTTLALAFVIAAALCLLLSIFATYRALRFSRQQARQLDRIDRLVREVTVIRDDLDGELDRRVALAVDSALANRRVRDRKRLRAGSPPPAESEPHGVKDDLTTEVSVEETQQITRLPRGDQ